MAEKSVGLGYHSGQHFEEACPKSKLQDDVMHVVLFSILGDFLWFFERISGSEIMIRVLILAFVFWVG